MTSRVVVSIRVPCSPVQAFDIFTQEIGDWWADSTLFRFTPRSPGQLAFEQVDAGEIKLTNFEQAASIYFDLLRSRIQFRTLLMPSYVPTEQEVREHVARAVKVFLGGIETLN